MSNDLLYTNRFFSKEELTKTKIDDRMKNQKNYNSFLRDTQNNVNNFFKKKIF